MQFQISHTARRWAAVVCLGCVGFASCKQSLLSQADAAPPTKTIAQTVAKPVVPPPRKRDASDDFFEQGRIPQIKIQINTKEEQKLRADQRKYVECTLVVDDAVTYKKVSVKLKGAAGSFRNLDDRPALTLNMNKKDKDQRFFGLDKFHLNNSVQDESLLSELLCSQICREAGCPAARTTHARVWINNRDLGMYVLKEGFDKEFLARNFSDGKGNLYDGGFLREIDQPLEKDEGEGVDDLSDLKDLVAALREPDATKRKQLINERLDVDAFLNFTALELMMGHWDGYVQNRNNYRVYFHPQTKKAYFLPHGMDQMFADANYSCLHQPGALAANVVLGDLEWKAKYRERVKQLLPLFAPAKLNAKIDAAHARVRPVIAAINEDRAKQFDARAQDMKNRVAGRQQGIRNQLRSGPPEPLVFDKNGAAKVEEWNVGNDIGDAKVEEVEINGQPLYAISTGASNRCVASWRRKVLLGKGNYRLEANARVTGVTPIEDDKGRGLGVRLGGGKRENQLTGTTQWQPVVHAFSIEEAQREVELVAELRAVAGKAWFDANSLKIVKLP